MRVSGSRTILNKVGVPWRQRRASRGTLPLWGGSRGEGLGGAVVYLVGERKMGVTSTHQGTK